MSEQRKRDFYAVAQKHDILILSDDPYRALQLHYPEIQGETPPERITGFLSIDTDGRVLDMSTFSKVSFLSWLARKDGERNRDETDASSLDLRPSFSSDRRSWMQVWMDHWTYSSHQEAHSS